MAKSLRSKWKRKMRAVKRVRYGEKELKRLNDMLIKAGDYQLVPEVKKEETAVMELDRDVIIVEKDQGTDGPRRSKFRKGRESKKEADEEMAVDKEPRVYSKRTMRDQFGNYPVWMNKRKMITQQKKNKRIVKRRAASVNKKR